MKKLLLATHIIIFRDKKILILIIIISNKFIIYLQLYVSKKQFWTGVLLKIPVIMFLIKYIEHIYLDNIKITRINNLY